MLRRHPVPIFQISTDVRRTRFEPGEDPFSCSDELVDVERHAVELVIFRTASITRSRPRFSPSTTPCWASRPGCVSRRGRLPAPSQHRSSLPGYTPPAVSRRDGGSPVGLISRFLVRGRRDETAVGHIWPPAYACVRINPDRFDERRCRTLPDFDVTALDGYAALERHAGPFAEITSEYTGMVVPSRGERHPVERSLVLESNLDVVSRWRPAQEVFASGRPSL